MEGILFAQVRALRSDDSNPRNAQKVFDPIEMVCEMKYSHPKKIKQCIIMHKQ